MKWTVIAKGEREIVEQAEGIGAEGESAEVERTQEVWKEGESVLSAGLSLVYNTSLQVQQDILQKRREEKKNLMKKYNKKGVSNNYNICGVVSRELLLVFARSE